MKLGKSEKVPIWLPQNHLIVVYNSLSVFSEAVQYITVRL